ncbi:MAG: LysR family transcriptional regulator [Puniceicoccales bacterium]|jgi:DNA-binding transcriptional LysR family regulator|nr:LysR family transcriptional regulator [Puniceicoccales bacterium]
MELRHFRYFVAVAEELNFRRAADRLNLSAPTLSVQIKQLEDDLNVQLLERDTSKVRLTGSGEFFLEESKKILERVEHLVLATRETSQGKRGVLRIGNAGMPSHEIVSAGLNEFQKSFPQVDVIIEEVGVNQVQMDALAKGKIHIGFIFQNEGASLPGFLSFPMVKAPAWLILSEKHPLAQKKSVSLKELTGERVLAIGTRKETSIHAGFMNSALRTRGIKPGTLRMANGPYAFFTMLAANQGVSIIGGMQGMPMPVGVIQRPIKESGPDLKMEVRMVWRKAEKSVPVLKLVETLQRFSLTRQEAGVV